MNESLGKAQERRPADQSARPVHTDPDSSFPDTGLAIQFLVNYTLL